MDWLTASNATLTSGMPLLEIHWWPEVIKPTVVTIILGVFAIALMMGALWVFDRMTTYSIHRQLEEKQNVAVAIVVAAVVIGIALVVSSVAQG